MQRASHSVCGFLPIYFKIPLCRETHTLWKPVLKISSVTSLAILYECGLGTLPPNPKSSSAGAGQERSLNRSGSGSYSRRELSVICTAKSVQVSPSIGNRVAEAQWDALDGQSLTVGTQGRSVGLDVGLHQSTWLTHTSTSADFSNRSRRGL